MMILEKNRETCYQNHKWKFCPVFFYCVTVLSLKSPNRQSVRFDMHGKFKSQTVLITICHGDISECCQLNDVNANIVREICLIVENFEEINKYLVDSCSRSGGREDEGLLVRSKAQSWYSDGRLCGFLKT